MIRLDYMKASFEKISRHLSLSLRGLSDIRGEKYIVLLGETFSPVRTAEGERESILLPWVTISPSSRKRHMTS